MSKPPPMGHNGGFFFESRSDLPPDLPKMHFFKCFIQDVLDDVLRLPNDERGFYLTALLVMYKEMEGLPADDKQASMSMLLDVRQYRRLKEKVMARGLLYQRSTGRVSNKRFEAEICAYVTEFNNRREAAVDREQRKRGAVTSPTVPRHFHGKSQRSLGDVQEISARSLEEMHGDFSKNINENNEPKTTSRPQADHEDRIRAPGLELELDSDSKQTNKDSSSAREGALDPKTAQAAKKLAVIFGSTDDPDPDRGLRVAQEWAAAFSPEDVLDAVMDYEAKRADRTEYRPLSEQLFGNYVRQAPINRARRNAGIDTPVDKPPPKTLEPGVLAEGYIVTDRHRIQLVNGIRDEWVERFGGAEGVLDDTLIEVSGHIKPNSPTPIVAQIESYLARVARDRKDGDIRYNKAVTDKERARQGPRTAANGAEKIETRAERLARMATEIEQKGQAR